MSEIKLFQIKNNKAQEIKSLSVDLEKSLQTLMKKNLESMFGIRFLQTEYSTGQSHGGRIDTLGIDENGSPVIIKYKRAISENVINQGLFYLDWLFDHKANFKLLVMECLGQKAAEAIDWSGPRLICIARDFTKYDEHAVKQINHNIDLIRFRRFDDDLLAIVLIHRTSANNSTYSVPKMKATPKKSDNKESRIPKRIDKHISDVYEALRAYLLALGDDVQEKHLKVYITY